MNQDQLNQVRSLANLQVRLQEKLHLPEFGERAFCNVLPDCPCPVDYSTLHKLKSNPDYQSRNLPKMLAALGKWAAQIRTRFFQNPNEWTRAHYVETPDFVLLRESVSAAIHTAKEGRPERAIWFLGDPGAGKSEAARRIVGGTPNSRYLLARQSWCSSYFGALCGIAGALGLGPQRHSAAAEGAILSHLAELDSDGNPPVLAIDELEFSGEFLWRLFKMILNESRAVLAFFCQPVVFDGLNRSTVRHAAQLCRRSIAVIRCEPVSTAYAAELIRSIFPGDAGAVKLAPALAQAAAVAGRWACVAEVLESLADSGADVTADSLAAAVKVYHGRAVMPVTQGRAAAGLYRERGAA